MAVNDIPKILTYSKVLLFADDIKIYKYVDKLEDCQQIQTDLDALVDWSYKNELPLNLDKCQCISFSLKSEPLTYPYRIEAHDVRRTTTVRDLGVLLDFKLTFNEHVEVLTKKAYRMLGFVIRNSRGLRNLNLLQLAYYSNVRSVLEFNAVIWDPFTKTNTILIDKIQKKFLKYLYYRQTGTYPNDIEYEFLMQLFKFKSLKERRTIATLKELYKVVSNIVECPELLMKLNWNTSVATTRGNELFYLNVPRVNVVANSPLYRAAMIYNLNANLLDISSTKRNFFSTLYKIKIKMYFINN